MHTLGIFCMYHVYVYFNSLVHIFFGHSLSLFLRVKELTFGVTFGEVPRINFNEESEYQIIFQELWIIKRL